MYEWGGGGIKASYNILFAFLDCYAKPFLKTALGLNLDDVSRSI